MHPQHARWADHGEAPAAAPPVTPRQFFNAGTQKLSEGKLREAEAFLESTLASQQARLQPPALYNLGHVRFRQGTEETTSPGRLAASDMRSARDSAASICLTVPRSSSSTRALGTPLPVTA